MRKALFLVSCILLAHTTAAQAHFGMVVPSTDTVLEAKDASLTVTYAFAHPFEAGGMDLEVERAQVIRDGEAVDITPSLTPVTVMGGQGFEAAVKLARPGVYTLAMTPKPYFEPAEDKYIIHYTKSVVAAFGEEEGWAEPAGLPVEIIPLTRPFAAWSGGVFRGKVLMDGKPVPGAVVEIERWNGEGGATYIAENDYFVTHTVMADDSGVFVASVPFAGWWGFAALVDGPEKMTFEGKDREVELGAVLWMRFRAPVSRAR